MVGHVGVRNKDMNAAWRHVDISMCVLVALTAAFGALMIFSTTRHKAQPYAYIEKHILFSVIGIVVMVAVSAIDYRRLCDWSKLIYPAAVLGLMGVLVPGIGVKVNGTRGWYSLGVFELQPAEFAKLATILAVAAYLGRLDETRFGLKQLGITLAMLGIPMGLIMLQPDLGTNLVFLVISVAVLVVAGIPLRYLVVLVVLGLAGIFAILSSNTLDTYQKDRLLAFAAPDSVDKNVTYNTRQAQTAIASGGTLGKGLFHGPQTTGQFVPEQQTDFIFTVPGEELGFVGSSALILLLGGIVWRMWRTARIAGDLTGTILCIGVLAMFVFHIFENVGMNLGIMPVTGIPLPFVSYGGSAAITAYAGVGLVMNVHMRRYD